MQLKYINYILTCIVALSMVSCKEDPIMMYDPSTTKSTIYFSDRFNKALTFDRTIQNDNEFISFGYTSTEKMDSIFILSVRATGPAAQEDRTFKVVADEHSTMKEGINFEFVTVPVILKGRTTGNVVVKIIRTPDMKKDTLSLKLRLVSNEQFQTNIQYKQNNAKTDSLDILSTLIYVDDITGVPSLWTSDRTKSTINTYLLGTFSREKLFLMMDILNLTIEDFNPTITSANSGQHLDRATGWASYMQYWLAKEAVANRFYYEADGVTRIRMGISYQ
ncbi:uncharacterized protein DUF4843 [Chitinophaga skermanii]|uniref:Uncharacterized protein DUF4843 n=1 Tax=Chitinophaga skermanii TaxID=331697 RepID=A0A327Q4M9_9BACT|nr:DUF4843 domain-containing protein [Chitinophaga skermanii]RAI99388.1 uncharacterized protein DUF4843 [Chitinophaga skermanii]